MELERLEEMPKTCREAARHVVFPYSSAGSPAFQKCLFACLLAKALGRIRTDEHSGIHIFCTDACNGTSHMSRKNDPVVYNVNLESGSAARLNNATHARAILASHMFYYTTIRTPKSRGEPDPVSSLRYRRLAVLGVRFRRTC